MPVQGSSMLGIFPDMDEEEHRILEKRIPLFQLVHPEPIWFPRQIHNFFGVRVESYDPDFQNSQQAPEWFTGGDAYITFKPRNKNGLGVAWVADDPWMHNRTVFLTNDGPKKMIKQLRRPNGEIFSAAEVLFEIACMDRVLRHAVPIWKVFRDGKELCPFSTEKDAQQYADDQGGTEIKLKDGTLQPLKVNKSKFIIEKGERREWKPEVNALMNRETNRHRFGWTESMEFINTWKPMILKMIEEQRNEFNEKNETVEVKAAVSAIDVNALSEDALDALSRRLKARQLAKNRASAGIGAKADEQKEEVAR